VSGRPRGSLALAVAAWLAAAPAFAQVIQTPREEFELETPPLRPPEPPPETVLPPIPPPPEREPQAAGVRVPVRAFAFEGNTAFDDAELAQVTAPWTGREITSEELRGARDAVTRHYIDAGYVTSGAVLPDQQLTDGVVQIQVVEGRLAGIEVEGVDGFRPGYFESRLAEAGRAPLQVQRLEERLQLFQQDPRIRRIAARLEPGAQRGETLLRLEVEEAFPATLDLEWSNDVPPSLGDQAGRADVTLSNLIGVGDELRAGARFAEGLTDPDLRYGVPVNRWDTELEVRIRYSDGEIVEEPFDAANFTSTAFTAGIGVLQPLWRTRSDSVRVALLGEWRRSKTEVDGFGIGFSGSGADPDDGESRISVLRLGGEWLRRTRERVFALRQLMSVGVPLLDATQNPSGEPDSSFVSFLTQARFAQRIGFLWDSELLLSGDLQLATRPLMPLEQIGIGGVHSVRGYRENQAVRDQAGMGSVELRLPLYRDDERGHLLQLAPFVDAGYAWSAHDRKGPPGEGSPGEESLVGAGVGIRYRFRSLLGAELYWGNSFSDVIDPDDDSLQDQGLYFRVSSSLP
jgi:hemolysin activation/secretion protein